MPKRDRSERYASWPPEIRENYIRLFSLQERMRAHLKMAQELARRNYQLKYNLDPRKTQPIRLANRPDDYLRRYREDQWPEIKYYLHDMDEEIQEIKSAYKGGRYPKWYESILMTEKIAGQILDKMEMIQAQLIITLRGNGQAIKEINQTIIDETAQVLILARDLREVLTFVPLDQAKIGLDKYGFEAILDLAKPHIMDLSILWQNQHRKTKRG